MSEKIKKNVYTEDPILDKAITDLIEQMDNPENLKEIESQLGDVETPDIQEVKKENPSKEKKNKRKKLTFFVNLAKCIHLPQASIAKKAGMPVPTFSRNYSKFNNGVRWSYRKIKPYKEYRKTLKSMINTAKELPTPQKVKFNKRIVEFKKKFRPLVEQIKNIKKNKTYLLQVTEEQFLNMKKNGLNVKRVKDGNEKNIII